MDVLRRFRHDPDAPWGVPHAIRTGATLVYPEVTSEDIDDLDVTDEARTAAHGLVVCSAMIVPLVKRGRVLGAIQLVMSTSGRHHTDADATRARNHRGATGPCRDYAQRDDRRCRDVLH